jgi:hypothetical protein
LHRFPFYPRKSQMAGHGEKRARHQETAVAALLTHPTLSEAAAHAPVNESTLRRWLKNPAFDTAYRDARQQIVQHAIAQVQEASLEAVATLRSILADAEAPAHARVSAARTVLELGLKAAAMDELDHRLAALEAALTPRRVR